MDSLLFARASPDSGGEGRNLKTYKQVQMDDTEKVQSYHSR
jgi:hypothetical protein